MRAGFGAMAVAAVAAAGCSGAQSRSVGCSKDTDCKDPRVCERGVCVDPRSASAGDPLAVRAAAADPSPRAAPAEPASAPPTSGPPPFAMFGGDARHTGRRGGA
ncbi:MAG TPA: hypothetical protein VFD36_20375, partial [Kofleriaceae bacterium]|nr:hypothetical protein [Kofleriaceae bacterium]